MNKPSRRYEILLPLRFNDEEAVPNEMFGEVVLELRRQFGSASSETSPIQGFWQHEGTVYRDDSIRVFVDVPDRPEHREFFAEYKETLKARFRQIEIWMTTYPIEII